VSNFTRQDGRNGTLSPISPITENLMVVTAPSRHSATNIMDTLIEIKSTDPARPEQIITWKGNLVDILVTDKTQIMLINTPTYGNILFMDGEVQSSELDYNAYHRALVAPVTTAVGGGHVIVLGGGEGCTSNEAFNCGAETVTQIDHDAQAIQWARRTLVNWNRGVYDDPRLNVVIDDAFARVRGPPPDGKRARIIVVDLFDPDISTLGKYVELIGYMVNAWLERDGLLVSYFGLWPNASMNMESVIAAADEAGLGPVRGYVKYVPCFCSECLFLVVGKNTNNIVLEPDMRWVF
jgi:spermidine synthase